MKVCASIEISIIKSLGILGLGLFSPPLPDGAFFLELGVSGGAGWFLSLVTRMGLKFRLMIISVGIANEG